MNCRWTETAGTTRYGLKGRAAAGLSPPGWEAVKLGAEKGLQDIWFEGLLLCEDDSSRIDRLMGASELPNSVDLANEADFRLGNLQVRPSTREVAGKLEREVLEPRVMQVLVTLARRRGQVVSRDHLIKECWGGRVVGEDAITRCIAKVRRLSEIHAGFAIETITRVGYRLTEDTATEHTDAEPAALPATRPMPPIALVASVESQVEPNANTPNVAVPSEPRAPRIPRWLYVALGAASLALVVAFGVWRWDGRVVAREPSIAVLPFDNLSGDPAKSYLATGVAMEIIDTLAQLKGIEVISRNSSFSFHAKADPIEVGAKLNVAHVLSGSVREEGDHIAVTAELLDAKSGRTIRADTYEVDLSPDRIGGLQTRVAENISGAMSIAFDVNARRRLDGTGTKSLEAYNLYLRGLETWWLKANMRASIDYFRKATDIDPDYGEAWAGMAIATASAGWSFANPAEAREQQNMAYGFARRAVELDPDLSIAQTMYAAVSTTQLQWVEADEAFSRALAISRSELSLGNWFFLLHRVGRIGAAAQVEEELEQVDPIRGINQQVVHAYAAQGKYDLVNDELVRRGWLQSAELVPLVNALKHQINVAAPRDAIRKTLEGLSRRSEQAPAELAARVLAVFDDAAKARTALRSAYADPGLSHSTRWELVPFLAAWYGDSDLVLRVWRDELPTNMLRTMYIWDPAFADARKGLEFKTLVRELGMVDYWRAKGWADKCRPIDIDDFECT